MNPYVHREFPTSTRKEKKIEKKMIGKKEEIVLGQTTYRRTFESLGNEHLQEIDESQLPRTASLFDRNKYFSLRRDVEWQAFPRILVPGRIDRKRVLIEKPIGGVQLLEMAPKSVVNVHDVWLKEKAAELEKELQNRPLSNLGGEDSAIKCLERLNQSLKRIDNFFKNNEEKKKGSATSILESNTIKAVFPKIESAISKSELAVTRAAENFNILEPVSDAIGASDVMLIDLENGLSQFLSEIKGKKDELYKKLETLKKQTSDYLSKLRTSFINEIRMTKAAIFEDIGQWHLVYFDSDSYMILTRGLAEMYNKIMYPVTIEVPSKGRIVLYLGFDVSGGLDQSSKTSLAVKVKHVSEEIDDDITKIRNYKKSNAFQDLRMGVLQSTPGRLIYLVELLQKALVQYNETNDILRKDIPKKDIFEIYWAIEEIGLLKFDVPRKEDDVDLIYDSFDKKVKPLIDQAKSILAQEKDLIKFQLVDMSNTLPPLSKYHFSYKLDEWQKRAIRWIESGKSVIICAPTSSGKTMLSSFVALTKRDSSALDTKVAPVNIGPSNEDEADEGDADDNDEIIGAEDDQVEEIEEEEYGTLRGNEHERYIERMKAKLKVPTAEFAKDDRENRRLFRDTFTDGTQRVLFIVPSTALVWQVGAYFSRLLHNANHTNVAIVTDQLTFHPMTVIGVMPQIVVGTPRALESALIKPRGRVGDCETFGKAKYVILPGGFDYFDWVIYDEVHSLNGSEGDALQRIIRCMNCKFLALSATIGNAEQLRLWMERVKGDQLNGVEVLNVVEPAVVAPAVEASANVAIAQIKVVKTLETESNIVISFNPETYTVKTLKEDIHSKWSDCHPSKQQLMYQKADALLDLADENKLVKLYVDLTPGVTPEIQMRQHINMITHEVRFINLQRYVWRPDNSGEKLIPLNPLAAVDSINDLRSGLLKQSALSMTSVDTYRVWEAIHKLYPKADIMDIDPNRFFKDSARITLKQSKDYEDYVKSRISELAVTHPLETQELLYRFRLEDVDKHDFNLCDLALTLKSKELLPAVAFHLNTFDAIALFQQVLAGLEFQQQNRYPNYYIDKQKKLDADRLVNIKEIANCGGDERAIREGLQAGRIQVYPHDDQFFKVDTDEPHPHFKLFCSQIQYGELLNVSDDMERLDGFTPRHKELLRQKRLKGLNPEVLNHALMRGLRRGIGLILNGVVFHNYRRAVQRFASEGKLGLVISDDSLAFGVNMPFRTCVFCGEMNNQLTPLLAQQMSGRAGRRGLDTQGNIVYAGSSPTFIRRLMLGAIEPVNGGIYHPKHDFMCLQGVLSERFCGWGRVETLGGRYLQEYCRGEPLDAASTNFSLVESKQKILELGFVEQEQDGRLTIPEHMPYEVLCMMWELRGNIGEALTFGRAIPLLHEEILAQCRSDKVLLEQFHYTFIAILLQFLDRTPYRETVASDVDDDSIPVYRKAMHKNGIYRNESREKILTKWSQVYDELWSSIPESLHHLRSPVAPFSDLDGLLLYAVTSENLDVLNQLSRVEKQELQDRIYRFGTVVKIAHNSLWPNSEYYSTVVLLLWMTFAHIRKILLQLVSSEINFANVSSDVVAQSSQGFNASVASAMIKFHHWKKENADNDSAQVLENAIKNIQLECHRLEGVSSTTRETCNCFPVSRNDAFQRAVQRLHAHYEENGDANVFTAVAQIQEAYSQLTSRDQPLIHLLVLFQKQDSNYSDIWSEADKTLSWVDAVVKTIEIANKWKAVNPNSTRINILIGILVSLFDNLQECDTDFLIMCSLFSNVNNRSFDINSLKRCSLVSQDPVKAIQLLCWLCTTFSKRFREPTPAAQYFDKFLKLIAIKSAPSDPEIELHAGYEAAIKDWYNGTSVAVSLLPALAPADLDALKASSAKFVSFVCDDDEDDDEDEDEDDEE